MKEIIRKREKGINEGLNAKEEDFLDVILSKQSLSYEEMVSIALDILLGGYETTSTLMALIMYFLAHAPSAFQKLKVPLPPSLSPHLYMLIHRDKIY